MEVVPIRMPRSSSPGSAVGLPFNRKNIEEWSRIDRLTGVREKAKIETDHWAARTNNAAHNYGKVVDSRERNNPDGSFQEKQRKQMEVFQTKVPGGSMQVIRTQTVTTSSKKWTSSNEKDFGDLELPVNSLDLSSQKTKGSVGRSGSIGGRRPPSRPRSLISQSSNYNTNGNVFREESSVFKLCQHLHQQAEEMFREFNDFPNQRGNFNILNGHSDAESDRSGVVITDVTNTSSRDSPKTNNFARQKSCSNENITVESDNESLLRRSSKVRRSLQCHKANHVDSDTAEEYDVSPMKSLKERAAEIEKLLRHGRSTYVSQTPEKPAESYGKAKFLKTKDCFFSAETLREVCDRLKKSNLSDNETKDDGIVSEKDESNSSSRISSFDCGLDSVNGTNKKLNINGTGSLESRSSNKNSVNGSRTSEWYKRRKSYGFEQVDEYDKFEKFNNKKNQIDSSTDSGICQSSETMSAPTWSKNTETIWSKANHENFALPKKDGLSSNIITVRVKKDSTTDFTKTSSNQLTSSSPDRTTINSVYLDGYSNGYLNPAEDFKKEDIKRKIFKHNYKDDSLPCESVWNRKSPIPYVKNNETRDSLKSSLRSTTNPWISQLRGTKLMDRNWDTDPLENKTENKFQTDAIHKSTVAFQGKEENGKVEGDSSSQKKSKKVEFCKTEVHFAAESGKFNIVETDGKPPPNDIFRRRRRSTGSIYSKNHQGLPETKFGDSTFEKSLLTSSKNVESINEKIEAELQELSKIVIEALPQSNKHENDNFERKNSQTWLYDVTEEPVENETSDSHSKPKSILKNYRNSFLLGENDYKKDRRSEPYDSYNKNTTGEPTPVWRSTVTLKNKRFDDYKKSEDDKKLYSSDGETELQMRLRSLRKTDPENKKLWDDSSYNSTDDRVESKRRSLPDDVLFKNSVNVIGNNVQKMSISTEEMPKLSVAERVKQVEQLKANNYSTKINFRSGEMTVIQNGTTNRSKSFSEDANKYWDNQRKSDQYEYTEKEHKVSRERPILSCDELTTSNPPVMRFSKLCDKTDSQNYQTTRILINFKTSTKDDTKQTEISSSEKHNKNTGGKTPGRTINTYGSWSSGMKKDLGRYLNDLKSASLVRETTQNPPADNPEPIFLREDLPKPSKTVHEIIDQFDSLSKSTFKPKTRKPLLISNKNLKEYTHSDLEEELKNFTENLDKDFRDIYEEEIGSLKKSKNYKEDKTGQLVSSIPKNEKADRPIKLNRWNNFFSAKSSSDEISKKTSLRMSSKDNYDTDDSDLLADEEVRSYMSAGHGGSDSETDGAFGRVSSRKSFEDSMLRFKKLESQVKRKKEIKNNAEPIQHATIYSKSNSNRETNEEPMTSPKMASTALKYQGDSYFSKNTYQNGLKPRSYLSNPSSNELSPDIGEKISSSTSKPRERVSYLNDLSLSEKYSKYLQRSSVSSPDNLSDCNIEKPCKQSNNLGEADDFRKQKTKKDLENRNYKHKLSHRSPSNDFVRSDHEKYIKEEKVLREKLKPSKYSSRTEHSEELRRSKTHSEKPNNRESASEKYEIQNYRTEKTKLREKNQTDEELEELKRAADQILMAVNGYTDDSSLVGSSEDDRPRRIIKKDKVNNLGTISEGKRIIKTDSRKCVTTSSHRRTNNNNQSSASSIESLTKESIQPMRELRLSSKVKQSMSSKPSMTRSTRLLQRATSREAIISHPSSSEDIPSYLEESKRRIRRQKCANVVKAESPLEKKESSSRHKSKTKRVEPTSTSSSKYRTSERTKESSSMKRSSRSSRAPDGEKTKASVRKTIAEKSEVESIKKRRSQRVSSREEYSSTQTRGNASKK